MLKTVPTARPATAEEEAYRYLLDAICTGRYAIGSRLVAEDVAQEIGTSRMPVREAFRRLDAEGLVTLRPNRGAVVSGLDIAQMREVFEMRSALEGLAIRAALPHLNERQQRHLERLLEDMDHCGDDSALWIQNHRAFHDALCALAGRPRLSRQIAALHALIEPHLHLWLKHIDKPLSAREEHAVLLEALRSGDPLRAERVMREHIEGTTPAIIAFLQSRS